MLEALVWPAAVVALGYRGLLDLAAANKALVRSLAGTQILLLFERIQGVIWLSQLSVLTYLNAILTSMRQN